MRDAMGKMYTAAKCIRQPPLHSGTLPCVAISRFSGPPANFMVWERLNVKPVRAGIGVDAKRAASCSCEQWDRRSTVLHKATPPPPFLTSTALLELTSTNMQVTQKT